MPVTAAICCTDLVKRYPAMDRNALDGLSFSLAEGAIVGLLGPNGAGKTTLTKLACGVTTPSAGDIRVLGRPPGTDGVRYHVGVVHQSATFDMMLSVLDNLKIAAMFKGERWRTVRPRVDQLLTAFGLAGRTSQLIFTLSGGEQRRLQVIRALIRVPRLLLLDEPSAGLDVVGRRQVWSIISDLRTTHGTTVMWTSHYVEELERNCDQVMVIGHGRMLEFASPRSLAERFGCHTAVLKPERPDDLRRLADAAARTGLTVGCDQGQAEVRGDDVRASIPGLLAHLEDDGIGVASVEFRAPSLEDAFLKLVGAKT